MYTNTLAQVLGGGSDFNKTADIGAAAVTLDFGTGIGVLRLVATADCFVRFDGLDATAYDTFLPAGVIEYFSIPKQYVSVIAASATEGTLYVSAVA